MSELVSVYIAETSVAAFAADAKDLPDELTALPAQARARVAALAAEIKRTGGTVGSTYGPRTTLTAALEGAIAAAYSAVQKLDDEQTLRVVAQVMAGDGQSLALLRLSMNRPPVPDAFETGKAP